MFIRSMFANLCVASLAVVAACSTSDDASVDTSTTTAPLLSSSFTVPGSFTYVVPAGVSQLKATVRGGGGGGGGYDISCGGNGGNGASAVGTFAVTPGQSITVQVGGGGAGGTGGTNAAGGNGGISALGLGGRGGNSGPVGSSGAGGGGGGASGIAGAGVTIIAGGGGGGTGGSCCTNPTTNGANGGAGGTGGGAANRNGGAGATNTIDGGGGGGGGGGAVGGIGGAFHLDGAASPPAGGGGTTATTGTFVSITNTAGTGATGSAGRCTAGTAAAASPGSVVIEVATGCGNEVLDAGEGCDDGNAIDTDGCTNACKITLTNNCNARSAGAIGSASCSSGVCDIAGNAAPGTCEAANVCGNGALEIGEGCDDGGTSAGDGCSALCTIETGNTCNSNVAGVTGAASCQSGVCDLTTGGAGTCEPALTCGNGLLESGESCDDGNTLASDGCNATCLIETNNPCGVTGAASCESGVCDTVGQAAPGMCEAALTCGNGARDAGEGCDDGNIIPSDGCDALCKIEDGNGCSVAIGLGAVGDSSCQSGICNTAGGPPGICAASQTCGNNVVELGEGCDDGARITGDGCDAACKIENGTACGTRVNGLNGSASCQSGICDAAGNPAPGICEAAALCGNSLLEANEGCDDGNLVTNDGCTATCLIELNQSCNELPPGLIADTSCVTGVCDQSLGQPGRCEASAACGNGRVDAGEGCDDGDTTSGDGCSATCTIEDGRPCGNSAPGTTGAVSCASGVCDVAGNNSPGVCEPANTCGNSVRDAGEGCDDGNATPGDGCGATCLIEDGRACANNGAASCESGVCDVTGGSPGTCEAASICGNGTLDSGEGCDDGNTAVGDACNVTCNIEDGNACNSAAPGLTGNGSCASGICDTAGNSAPGVCEPQRMCGNGVLEAGEGCDDANVLSGDACDAACDIETGNACNDNVAGTVGNTSCASAICNRANGAPGVCSAADVCGNGVREVGEGCDDGNTVAADGCTTTCKIEDNNACNQTAPGAADNSSCASGVCNTAQGQPGVCLPVGACGNNVREGAEGCDDGNRVRGDGCNEICKLENGEFCTTDEVCASGVCDPASQVCEPANQCGNGALEANEGCDDGNTVAGDGCTMLCRVETGQPCGPGGGTSCESGVCDTMGHAAPGVCEPAATCGNGRIETDETCDDGNTVDGDACNSRCGGSVCTEQTQCGTGTYCKLEQTPGSCVATEPPGSSCSTDFECQSANCVEAQCSADLKYGISGGGCNTNHRSGGAPWAIALMLLAFIAQRRSYASRR